MVKKKYSKPGIEVTEFRFTEHIATSGGSDCYWGSGATWSHREVGCNTNYHPGQEGWIGLNG